MERAKMVSERNGQCIDFRSGQCIKVVGPVLNLARNGLHSMIALLPCELLIIIAVSPKFAFKQA